MKRLITCLLVIIFSLSAFVTPAFAASTKYKLDELGLEVSIPSKYDVITQDTSPYSSIFSDRGLSGTDLIKQFKENGVYLNAVPNDGTNEEIVVTMTTGIWDNLSSFSNSSLKTIASSLVKEYEDYGLTITNYDVYEHSQAKFIRIFFNDTEKTVHGVQYYTNYGAKTINVTIRSYSGAISQTQENTIKGVVDSIVFDTAPVAAPSVPETGSFVYTDIETNTTFTVPANWYEKELFKDREYIDVKFVSGKEEGLSIMYGSTDLWGEMTASEKAGFSRSDFDTSQFTEEDMKEYFVGADNVKKVTYNGIDYFMAVQKSKQEMYGTEFIVELTRVVRFYNGWLYEFQFGGTKESEYFADFEALLSSVRYANNSNMDLLNPSGNTTNNSNGTNSMLLWGTVVTVLLITIVLVVIWYVRKNKEDEQSTEDLPDEEESDSEASVRCSNCGSKLADDSLFCHVCGAKTFKEDNAE